METQTPHKPQRRNSPAKVAQAHVPGPLSTWLGSRHEAGRSWQDIANDVHLLTDGQVNVTRYAVRKWALGL